MSSPDRAGSAGRSVLLLGGTSAIGTAITDALIRQQPGPVLLATRAPDRATEPAARLRAAGATDVGVIRYDAAQVGEAAGVVAEAAALLGRIDIVIVASGSYADTAALAGDLDATLELVTVNLLGAIAAGEALRPLISAQGSGRILALSSRLHPWALEHAGVYAASKAGFDTYYRALGADLRAVGGEVLVIRPPGVNTPLVEQHPSYHSPEEVAVEVLTALADGSTELTIDSHEEQRSGRRSVVRRLLARRRRRTSGGHHRNLH